MKVNPAGLLIGMVLLVFAGVGAYVVFAETSLPSGPSRIIWDRQACAFCSMHVGEPAFAAQLQTKRGETLAFDDPGCLFLFESRNTPEVHAIWFRHHREDRWIEADKVAFVRVSPTPMGYDLGAVDVGTPGSMPLDQARRLVLAKGSGGR